MGLLDVCEREKRYSGDSRGKAKDNNARKIGEICTYILMCVCMGRFCVCGVRKNYGGGGVLALV